MRPECLIERICPVTFASSYLDGLTIVAVNRSPTRASLLDNVLFNLIRNSEPEGMMVVVGRRLLCFVWASTVVIIIALKKRAENTAKAAALFRLLLIATPLMDYYG